MRVAVVTIVHGRHDHLLRQRESLARGSRRPDEHVVVAMDDPVVRTLLRHAGSAVSTVDLAADGPELPLARARNVGVQHALDRGAEVVVLLDVDCLAGPDLVQGYATTVHAEPRVIWSGPTTYLPPPPVGGYDLERLAALDHPHPARPAPAPGELVRSADPDLFWSLSFAVSGSTWQHVGGFCEAYRGYGGEDTDFARLATARGITFGWCGTPRAYHQHHPTDDPPVQHWESILRNATLFHRRWGAWPMLGWLEEFERRGLVARTVDGGFAGRSTQR
jgi:GT2 family glycosyltransferase